MSDPEKLSVEAASHNSYDPHKIHTQSEQPNGLPPDPDAHLSQEEKDVIVRQHSPHPDEIYG